MKEALHVLDIASPVTVWGIVELSCRLRRLCFQRVRVQRGRLVLLFVCMETWVLLAPLVADHLPSWVDVIIRSGMAGAAPLWCIVRDDDDGKRRWKEQARRLKVRLSHILLNPAPAP